MSQNMEFTIKLVEEEDSVTAACKVYSADCIDHDKESLREQFSTLRPGEVYVLSIDEETSDQVSLVVTAPDLRKTEEDAGKELTPSRFQEWHLRMAYLGSCFKAEELGKDSIMFTLLSVGKLAMSTTEAINIAMQTIVAYVETNPETCLKTFIFAISNPEWLENAQTCLWYMGAEENSLILNFEASDAHKYRKKLEKATVQDSDCRKKCKIPILGFKEELRVASYVSCLEKNAQEKTLIEKQRKATGLQEEMLK